MTQNDLCIENIYELSLEELVSYEIEHAELQYRLLSVSSKLCSKQGREVIAEYEFTGNVVEVLAKLQLYIMKLEDNQFTETDKLDLIIRKQKLIEYIEQHKVDFYQSEIVKAIKEHDMNKVIDLTNQRTILRESLHENKMCECYNN